MSDWKEDLDKKFNELKKEGKDGVYIETSSGVHNRNSSGRGRDADLSNIRKEVNKDKGGVAMISKEGAIRDIDDIVSKGEYIVDRKTKKVVKLNNDLEKLGAIVKVLLTFLNTMRSNQLLPETEKVRLHEARKTQKEKEQE
jgi:hypothetical protein